jgi:SNF2 domain-containing protein/SNF2 helicase protein/helicase-like protein
VLCGDNGPRYRTRREIVDLFARHGVTIDEPAHGSRRQIAMAGLEELHRRPDGMAAIVAAIGDPVGKPPSRVRHAGTDRSGVLDAVLEQIRKRFGEVLTSPRPLSGRGSYRPCFRLTLGEGGAAWLDGHLQSTTDPSLVVPLEEVAGQHASAFAFGRRSFSPGTAVTTALRKAAVIFPPIGRLQTSRPWTELDADELSLFVSGAARELAQAGFGVVLPSELTTAGRRRLALRVHVTTEQPPDGLSSGLTAGTLATFRWEPAIDGETLTPDEFREIADAKRELVRWRDRWILVDERDIAGTAAVAGRTQTMPLARAAGAVLAGATSVGGVEAEVVPDAPLAGVLERLSLATAPPDVTEPDGFVGRLRGYQARGVGWLSHLEAVGFGGCLADDMGLGKTIMVIALALRDPRTTLVVCPTSVIGNWEHEIRRFAPGLTVVRQHGSGRARTTEALAERLEVPGTIVLTSYGLLRRDRAILAGVAWGRVVLDEAQNVKNPLAQQTRAAYALRSDSRLALTGTPVENRLTDLWSIMQFCNPGLLGPAEEFAERFAGPVERGDARMTERLRRIVRPFVLRRVKSDPDVAPDLPEKFVSSVFCPLTPEQATLYRAAVDEMLEQIARAQGMARRGRILALITALKQICDHPALFLKQSGPLPQRSGKLARLTEMLEEVVAEGEAALVFTQYASMGRLLKSHLSDALGTDPLFLHGGTARASRDRMVERFQSPEGPQIFLLSLKAGGTGLNLTRATHVFHFDRWWNPAVEDQATDRTHRIGQTKNVMVHALTVSGTLEERINDLLERKRGLAERIVGAGEGWLTELSDEDLSELVSLSVADVTDLR